MDWRENLKNWGRQEPLCFEAWNHQYCTVLSICPYCSQKLFLHLNLLAMLSCQQTPFQRHQIEIYLCTCSNIVSIKQSLQTQCIESEWQAYNNWDWISIFYFFHKVFSCNLRRRMEKPASPLPSVATIAYILKATQSAEFVFKILRKKCVNYDDKISRQKCEIIKITRISCQCGIFVENAGCFNVLLTIYCSDWT